MELLLVVIIFVLAVLIEWYISKQFYEAANAKGYYDKKYFWICFLMSWVGYLLIIALPDRGGYQQGISDELPEL